MSWIWNWLIERWPSLSDRWPTLLMILVLVDAVLAASATVHIVLRKRDSRAAIGWAGLVWLAPLIGVLAYFGLGVNRIQRRR